jgi:SRSO17 transposase
MDSALLQRFDRYMDRLSSLLHHADRVQPLRDYCHGLFSDSLRKSIEPLAARLEPLHPSSKHQSLHHFVANADWSDEALLGGAYAYCRNLFSRADTRWLIVDDTAFPKKGEHSVGVGRQYCGRLGKQENCQVAVSWSLATPDYSLPIAYRLYLPEEWAKDKKRRERAGVPEEVVFKTKPQIALDLLRALPKDMERGVVLADAGYGNDTGFRTAIAEMELSYAVGVQGQTAVWLPGDGPALPPLQGAVRKMGRPRTRLRRKEGASPKSLKEVAFQLDPRRYRTVAWREGAKGVMTSRFAACRVRASHRDTRRSEPYPEEWLIVEWPKGEREPTKYFLSNLPETTSLRDLVFTLKGRWRVERDYQELKSELGLSHFEGRGWRGFHHHGSLCMAAYAFLVAERGLFPPGPSPEGLQPPALPKSYKPRGAPASEARAA